MANLRKKFSKIYDDNIEKVYRFIYLKVNSKEIAEDLTSEVFLRTWERFKQDRDNPIDNPRAFLYRTARNLVIDYYRAKAKRSFIPADDLSLPDPGPGVEEKAFQDSDLLLVKQSLTSLKEDYQDVIICRYLDDMTIPEIARTFDKSEEAVRVMLHRALKSLKNQLS